MYFKLVSPFRCPFNIKSNAKLAGKKSYNDFWADVKLDFDNELLEVLKLNEISFPHATTLDNGLRYSRFRNDSLTETIELSPDPSVENLIERSMQEIEHLKLNSIYKLDPTTIKVKLFDNTVGIFEANIDISQAAITDEFENVFSNLETWSQSMMNVFMSTFYTDYIEPVFQKVWQIKEAKAYLQLPGEASFYIDLKEKNTDRKRKHNNTAYNYSKFGEPLWLSRTLCFQTLSDDQFDYLVDHWLILEDGKKTVLKSEFESGETVYLGWRHSLINYKRDKCKHDDAIKALLLCQYFYTVFDFTEFKLSEVLGLSVENASSSSIKQNSLLLEEAVSTINILRFQLNDAKLNLERNQERFFKILSEIFKMDILIGNVEVKLGFCNDRIKYLHQRLANKSRIISEWLLFTIGGIALIDFIANLSSIALSLKPSYGTMSNDEMIPGLLTVALNYEPNLLLWGGVLILFINIFIYTYFHTKSQ